MIVSERGISELNIIEMADISCLVGEHTTQNQFDALTSLASSIGIELFERSIILKKHNAKCYPCAQGQFMVWAHKRGNRRQRMKEREVYYYGYEAQ